MEHARLFSDADQTIKRLFGAPVRAYVAEWILQRRGAVFYQLETQDSLRSRQIAPSAVAGALRAFVEEGLLMRAPDGNRVYFQVVEHPIWDVYTALGQVLRAAEVPSPLSGSPGAS